MVSDRTNPTGGVDSKFPTIGNINSLFLSISSVSHQGFVQPIAFCGSGMGVLVTETARSRLPQGG